MFGIVYYSQTQIDYNMKILNKSSLLAVLLCAVVLLSACSRYSVFPTKVRTQREITGGVIYALPKTYVRVDVIVEKTDYDASPYIEFAEELLGIVPVDDEGANYKISKVSISAINKPDPEAYFYVEPNLSNLSVQITRQGLLRAINSDSLLHNATIPHAEPAEKLSKIDLTELLYEPVEVDDDEDEDIEGEESEAEPRRLSLEDRAKAAAETIMDIRTKKREILYGEYESEYDSKFLGTVYKQLEEQEQKYLQLFTGVKTSFKEVFYIEPDPSQIVVDDQTIELFRFDEDKGILDSNSAEGNVVYCNLRCENEMYVVNKYLKQKPKTYFKYNSKLKQSSRRFRYRIPELVTVSLITPQFTYQKQLKVAQYGPVMELPRRNFEVVFDENTGELIYYKNK